VSQHVVDTAKSNSEDENVFKSIFGGDLKKEVSPHVVDTAKSNSEDKNVFKSICDLWW
jgi:hypothetical protein